MFLETTKISLYEETASVFQCFT